MKHFDVNDFHRYKIYSAEISEDVLKVRPELLFMAASDVGLEDPRHLKNLQNLFGLFAILVVAHYEVL